MGTRSGARADPFGEHVSVIKSLYQEFQKKDDLETIQFIDRALADIQQICAGRESSVKNIIKGKSSLCGKLRPASRLIVAHFHKHAHLPHTHRAPDSHRNTQPGTPNTRKHTHAHTHTHTHTHACTPSQAPPQHTQIYTRAHTHTHTYKHTHAQYTIAAPRQTCPSVWVRWRCRVTTLSLRAHMSAGWRPCSMMCRT